MLVNIRTLNNVFNVEATDGAVGTVEDAYFDDERWVIRYLVVNTRAWVRGRKVLISPLAVKHFDGGAQKLHLSLTQQKVDNSPPIDLHRPVSRVMESQLNRYYGFPDYWAYGMAGPVWGWAPLPTLPAQVPEAPPPVELQEADAHLRSAAEVVGYHIRAKDKTFGHLEDMIYDSDSWAIRYLLVDTRNWWPGPPVIVRPDWASGIDWASRTISFDMEADRIKACPPYDVSSPLTREYETALHEHYQRSGYWR